VLLAGVSAACGPDRPAVPAGGWGPEQSGAPTPAALDRPPAPRLGLIPSAQRRPWEQRLDALRPAGPRGPSEHGDGSLERSVLVNEQAASYAELSSIEAMPVGALLVERHHPAGRDEVASIYAMLKRAAGYAPEQSDWEFFVIDAGGRVAARGKLAPCARCHLEAPFDALFGPGRRPAAEGQP
jgi:hypothetical protein